MDFGYRMGTLCFSTPVRNMFPYTAGAARETPHRLQLRIARGAAEFTARWQSAPLWDAPLATLRMPS